MSEVMEKEVKAKKPGLRKWKITFHGEGGDVEIGHNAKLNVYKRNVETVIDEHYLGVLKDAVIYTIVEDDQGRRRNVTIPTISYSLGEEVFNDTSRTHSVVEAR
jgi:hypothetical protein